MLFPAAARFSARLGMSVRLATLSLCVVAAVSACNEKLRSVTAPITAPGGPSRLSVPAGDLSQLSAGGFHTCAIKSGETVICWGNNTDGVVTGAAGLTGVTQLSAGGRHMCALTSGATVTCWGNNSAGEVTVPAGLTGVLQVSAGDADTCALQTGGTVTCWGNNDFGQTTVPAGLTGATQVSNGVTLTCALQGGGTVKCWGHNYYGQTTVPSGLTGVTQVSAGGWHACALKSGGTVTCWGENFGGQTTVPSGLTGVTQIGTGYRYTCALKSGGTVTCWGANDQGQTTVPSGLTGVTQISAGGQHTCALTSGGHVTCWGYNGYGQLGPPYMQILPIATFATPASVVVGQPAVLALTNAQVPGHPEATAFTFAFDCGDGAGYAAPSSTASRSCPTTAAGSLAVKGMVFDQHSDMAEYTATVTVTAPTAQTISFTSTAPSPALIGGAYTITATGGASGNAVTFSSLTPGTCTVSGGAVSFVAVGTCTIAANQDGNAGYLAAPQETQSITVTVSNHAPVLSVPTSYTANEGSVISLGWSASDADGDALSYSWDFGNGVTGSGATLPTSYTYPDNPLAPAASFTISVTANDGTLITTRTATATIANVAPSGTFATSATAGHIVIGYPLTLAFSNVTDPSSTDLAAGIGQSFTCTGGASYTATSNCPSNIAGIVSVGGRLTDKDAGVRTTPVQSITVDAARSTVTIANASGQYSDLVTLTATLTTNAGAGLLTSPTGTMEFFVDGNSVGSASVYGVGALTKAITITQAAAAHALTARFTSADANYLSSSLSSSATLSVAAENATLTYATTNPASVKVASAGGTSGTFTLQVAVAETQPDLAAGSTAAAGDITRAPVSMSLSPVGPGSTVNANACAGSTAASGYSTRTYTCSFSGVAVNTYAVLVRVVAIGSNTYYVGSTEDVLTVSDPSLGFVTGGGSFAWPGSGERTTFGFTMKYKNASNPNGNLVLVRHMADGTLFRVKSNAITGLAVSAPTSTSGVATFSGKGTYMEPGWTNPVGNYSWTVYAEDNNEPGTGSDRMWIQVTNGTSLMMTGPAVANAALLTGGNIVVAHGGR